MPSGLTLLSVALLASAIWAVTFLLRKARRERDTFGIACSVLVLLVALLGWFFLGPTVM